MKKIILLGAPGAGKGTQAQMISDEYSIPKLSTGDMLREEIAKRSDLGLKIQTVVNAGDFVSDDIMIALINARISEKDCSNGFILDGFPRTLEQAKQLSSIIKPDECMFVIAINVDENEIVNRVSGRFTCAKCGAGYHKIYKHTEVEGICDKCGSKEFNQRDDDKPEAVQKRIKVYHEKYTPVIKYYKDEGALIEFDGMQDIDFINKNIVSFINGRASKINA